MLAQASSVARGSYRKARGLPSRAVAARAVALAQDPPPVLAAARRPRSSPAVMGEAAQKRKQDAEIRRLRKLKDAQDKREEIRLAKAEVQEWPRLTASTEPVKNHRVWWEGQECVQRGV